MNNKRYDTSSNGNDQQQQSSTIRSSSMIRKRRNYVLQRIRQHKADEEKEMKEWKQLQKDSLNEMVQSYRRGFVVLLIIGGVLLWIVKPSILFRSMQWGPPLPNRNLIILYPSSINIRTKLPRFISNYAIATSNNVRERLAIQHVQKLRNVATYVANRKSYNHKLYLTAWESSDFDLYLKHHSDIDYYCGTGFQNLYQQYKRKQQLQQHSNDAAVIDKRIQDLIYFCLLRTGVGDGYISWDVTAIKNELTHGIRGLAVIRTTDSSTSQNITITTTNRINPDLLLLPILSKEQLQQRQYLQKHGGSKIKSSATDSGPSTTVPFGMISWLVQVGPLLSDDKYQQRMEEYLYEIIHKESLNGISQWDFLHSICDTSDANTDKQHTRSYRRIATTSQSTDLNYDSMNTMDYTESSNNILTPTRNLSINFCTFYDPNIQEKIPVNKRQLNTPHE